VQPFFLTLWSLRRKAGEANVMDSNRKYAFNLPWRGVVAGALLHLGLAVFIIHKAKEFTGAIFGCLVVLAGLFIVLACILVIRRLIFPRVLELTDDAVLFPRGFPKTRITRFRYADIIRMTESNRAGQSSFCMITGTGRFEIGAAYFPHVTDYRAVRDFIFAKALVPTSPHDDQGASASKTRREFPDPILRWREPDDWARYRTFVFTSKPLFPRLAKALWFCVRCLAIIIIPWFVLRLCGVPTAPTAAYISLASAATLFFTSLHWLFASHPVHATEISFRSNGITQFFGKQIMDLNYGQVSGWAVVERQFEGRVLLILLLQITRRARPNQIRIWDWAFALPDANIRDQVVRIFQDKQVPHLPDLKPSWERG
jgi:hypothetical protein